MATYGNNNINTNPATKTINPNYATFVYNGIQYKTLEEMINRIARERAKVSFKSTVLTIKALGVKKTDTEVVESMIKANEQMIHDFLKNRDTSDELFGL